MDIWMKILYCVMFHELRCDHFRFLTGYHIIFFIVQSLNVSLLTSVLLHNWMYIADASHISKFQCFPLTLYSFIKPEYYVYKN